MAERINIREAAAKGFHERRKALRGQIAESLMPAPKTAPVNDDDARKMFWLRDPVVDEEVLRKEAMVNLAMMPGVIEMDPEELGKRVDMAILPFLYPKRQEIVEAGERKIDITQRQSFSDRMAGLGPPEEDITYG